MRESMRRGLLPRMKAFPTCVREGRESVIALLETRGPQKNWSQLTNLKLIALRGRIFNPKPKSQSQPPAPLDRALSKPSRQRPPPTRPRPTHFSTFEPKSITFLPIDGTNR
jgi:hypothetical protein